MAIGLGFKGAILGLGEEVTWSTAVTPTQFVELTSDGIAVDEQRLESAGINAIFRDEQDVKQAGILPSGDFEYEMRYEDQEFILKHAIGSVSSAQLGATAAYKHTFTLTDELPTGLTFEVDRDTSAFTVNGGKINTLSMTAETNSFLTASAGVIGKDLSTGSVTASTLPDGDLICFQQITATYGGASIDLNSFSFNLDNKLKSDDYKLGSRNIAEPTRTEKREITGTMSIDFDGLSEYDDFRNMTSRALIITATGVEIESPYNYELVLTFGQIKLTAGTPLIDSEGIIPLELPFKAYATDSSDLELLVELTNTKTSI